jgi:hypothetical protein
VFVGLVATIGRHSVRLSARGREAFWNLRRAVGADRVLLRVLRATDCSDGRVRVDCDTQVVEGESAAQQGVEVDEAR